MTKIKDIGKGITQDEMDRALDVADITAQAMTQISYQLGQLHGDVPAAVGFYLYCRGIAASVDSQTEQMDPELVEKIDAISEKFAETRKAAGNDLTAMMAAVPGPTTIN